MAKNKLADTAHNPNVVSPREQIRRDAHQRIQFDGNVNWPDDFLAAYAPDSVDIAATSKTFRDRYENLAKGGGDARKADTDVLLAALTVLQCWCEYKREMTRGMISFPIGPTGVDVNSGKAQLTWKPCFNANQSDLREMVWDCCGRFKWKIPSLPDIEKLGTHQDAIDFIKAVEDWIYDREAVAKGEKATKVPTQQKRTQRIYNLRILDAHGMACIKEFKEYRRNGDPRSMLNIVREYASENKEVSESGLYRRLNDNSDHWKPNTR